MNIKPEGDFSVPLFVALVLLFLMHKLQQEEDCSFGSAHIYLKLNSALSPMNGHRKMPLFSQTTFRRRDIFILPIKSLLDL